MAQMNCFRPVVQKCSRDELNHNNSQCWKLAHEEVAHLPLKSKLNTDDLKQLKNYEFTPGSYVVELEISDPNYKLPRRGFFLPRLFCHSFNVIVFEDRVEIRQSWFKIMKYQTIYVFTRKEFEAFQEHMVDALRRFMFSPMALFRLFGHTNQKILFVPLNHLNTMRKEGKRELKYRIDIYKH